MRAFSDAGSDYLSEKVKRLMLVRLLVVLGALLLIAVRASPPQGLFRLSWPPYWIVVMAAALNLLYILLFRRIRHLEQFAAVQIAIDTLLVGALVLFTGGISSVFNFLFFACVIEAGLILSTALALATAGLASSLLVFVATTYYIGTSRFFDIEIPFLDEAMSRSTIVDLPETVSLVMVQVSVLLLMALILSKIVQRLSGAHVFNEEILDNMSEGVVAVDRDVRVVYINRAARRMLVLSETEDFTGVPIGEALAAPGHEALARAIATEGDQAVEFELSAKGTCQKFPVEVVISRLRGRKAQSRGSVAVISNLTQRRKMESALRRMERLEVVERMSTAIAHEIRNPLASIHGSAQMLLESDSLADEDRKFLQLIVKESDRLDALVTDFMLFSRPQKMKLRECRIGELVDEVVTMMSKSQGNGSPEVDVDMSPDLSCLADRDLLKQVLYNMTINAFQAMSNGGKLMISARPMTRESEESYSNPYLSGSDQSIDGVSISFRDEGPGVPPEIKSKLFDPFFTTKTRGTGIGLAIVDRIVEAHGGHISVDNPPGGGAKFCIWLPVDPSAYAPVS